MKTLCTIGEALIDFIPEAKGMRLKDVMTFKKAAGGAPANVAAAVSILGGKSKIITQLGDDAFGDYLEESMKEAGIDTKDVFRTKDGDTALAFVSLAEDGNRDFKFYRRTSADLTLSEDKIHENMLKNCGIVHFCSVDLVESPMKRAHQKLIDLAMKQQIIVSFDPNLRLSLWESEVALKNTVHAFIPYAHILKLADEELEFITGYKTIEEALPSLFVGNVTYLIFTRGKDGVQIFRKDGSMVEVSGHVVEVKDTTGAGDSFIGAFLYRLLEHGMDSFYKMTDEMLIEDLTFSNLYAAHTTTKEGAITAKATQSELEIFKNSL